MVVSGTRTPENAQRATVRTEVVTREDAERRGATNVAEALAGETTLQVNPEAYGYLGRPSGVQVQGLDADRVLVLEDGERVLGDVGGVVDLAQLSLTDVDRVEYVGGPMSSLYGTNALGGVINILSAPPAVMGLGLRYRAELRSRREALAELSAAHREGDDWQALDATWHLRPGLPYDDQRPDLLVPDGRFYALGMRSGARPSPRMELRFKARWSHDRTDGLETQTLQGRPYVIDLPEATHRLGVQGAQILELGNVRLSTTLRRSWFVNDGRKDLRGSEVDDSRERRLSNQSFEGTATIQDGQARTWVLGLRSEAEHFEQRLTKSVNQLSGPPIRNLVQEVPPTLVATGAMFGQLAWRIGERWTLMPGVRSELHNRYGGVVAPRLAMAVAVTEALSVRASMGRGFRAPTAREFGFQFDHSSFGYRVLGNSELVPETSWGATGDVTLRVDGFRVRAGAFANAIRELITIQLLPVQPVGGVTDYRYENVARARTAGGDVSIRSRIGEGMTAEAGYAYLWTRDETNQAPLPNRPSHTMTLGVHGNLPWGLRYTIRYKGVSSTTLEVDGEPRSTPGFGLLDARLGVAFSPALEAYCGGLNLGDSRRNISDPYDTRPAIGTTLYVGVRGRLAGEEE